MEMGQQPVRFCHQNSPYVFLSSCFIYIYLFSLLHLFGSLYCLAAFPPDLSKFPRTRRLCVSGLNSPPSLPFPLPSSPSTITG